MAQNRNFENYQAVPIDGLKKILDFAVDKNQLVWFLSGTDIGYYDGKNTTILKDIRPKTLIKQKFLRDIYGKIYILTTSNDVYELKDKVLVKRKDLIYLKNFFPAKYQLFHANSKIISKIADFNSPKLHFLVGDRLYISSKEKFIRMNLKNGNIDLSINKDKIKAFKINDTCEIILNNLKPIIFNANNVKYGHKIITKKLLKLFSKINPNIQSYNYSTRPILIEGTLIHELYFNQNKELDYRTISKINRNDILGRIEYMEQNDIYFILKNKKIFTYSKNQYAIHTINGSKKTSNVNHAIIEFPRNCITNCMPFKLYGNRLLKDIKINKAKKFFSPYTFDSEYKKYLYLNYDYGLEHFIIKVDTDFKTVKTYKINSKFGATNIKYRNNILYYTTIEGIGYLDRDSSHTLLKLDKEKLDSINIICFELYKGYIYYGTNYGLFKINLTTKKVTKINYKLNIAIQNIYKDADENLWLLSINTGVYICRNEKIAEIKTQLSNSLKEPLSIIQDHKKRIWISTEDGLYTGNYDDVNNYINSKAKKIFFYEVIKSDDLINTEFSGGGSPNSIINSQNIVSFAVDEGFLQLNLNDTKLYIDTTKIFIDSIEVNNTKKKWINNSVFNSPKLKIYTSSVYFGNRNNLFLEYKLNDTSRFYTQIPFNGIIDLDSLEPNKYKLLIRKRISLDTNNYKYYIYEFKIEKDSKFNFKLVLVILIITIALILMFLVISRYNLYLAEKKGVQLEILIKEKTHQLKHTITELSLSNQLLNDTQTKLKTNLSNQERMLSILAHDLKSPLKFTSITVEHLYKELSKQEASNNLATMASTVNSSLAKMHNFLEDILVWNSDKTKFQIESNGEDVVKAYSLILNIVSIQKLSLNLKNNKVILNIPDNIFIEQNVKIITVIIRNLIDNANKNTDNGKIKISAKAYLNRNEIIIKDTGVGFKKEFLDDINKKDYDNLLIKLELNRQFGYQFIINLIVNYGFNITIYNNIKGGATVVFIIPKKMQEI